MSEETTRADDCWNRIGVWSTAGSRCERLGEVVHCRNCEVFVAAGRRLFERESPPGYLRENLAALVREEDTANRDSLAIMVFRLGVEFFALPVDVLEAVTESRPVHRLPHVNDPFVKGVVNISGEVCLCHSLKSILGTASAPHAAEEGGRHVYRRLIVIRISGVRYIFPVDEILGMSRYQRNALRATPATIGREIRHLFKGAFRAEGDRVAVLDTDALHRFLHRGAR